jgi:hypothetical protein
MLRAGFWSSNICAAAAAILAGGCSNASPPSLPSLSDITGTVSEGPVVGDPTEVYSRVARGAMACWFGTAGPLKADYVYHAEAEPAGLGGKAEILIHERDRSKDTQKGEKAFRVGIAKEGEATSLTVENFKLPGPMAKSMEADVRRWGAGSIGCVAGDKGWELRSPEAEEAPKAKKAKTPAKKTGGA